MTAVDFKPEVMIDEFEVGRPESESQRQGFHGEQKKKENHSGRQFKLATAKPSRNSYNFCGVVLVFSLLQNYYYEQIISLEEAVT